MKFKSIGKNVKIFETAKLVFPENIEIGDNVIIDDFVLIIAKKRVKIGNNVHIASFVSITGNEDFIMEDFTGLSTGVRVLTSSDDYVGGYLTNPTVDDKYKNVFSKETIIKRHGIIGANTVILPGSIVEEGTAIGANSLVKGTTEAYTVYVGNPIRKICSRNKERLIKLEGQFINDMSNL